MTATVQADSGTVVNVYTVTLGDELASDHATGSTTLTVRDCVDFADDGGWLTIGAETLYYDSAVDDDENDVGVIALSTPLANAYLEGERVTLDPPSFEKFADVMVGNFGEAVEAVIPHALWDKVADGVRADGEGEVVTLTLSESTFVVADVVGMAPIIDGSYLDPTVPLPPELAGTSWTWRGLWDAGVVYEVDDAVSYGGSSYRRVVAGTTPEPPDTDDVNWAPIALAGAQGDPGDTGASAYEQWLAAGNTGTEADFLASLEGPAGPASDGVAPASSPAATVASNAVGQLQVSWPSVANADPVMYKVYLSTTTPVPINSGTLLTSTPGLTVATMVGAGGGALTPNVRYYARVLASDADGDAASVGAEGSAVVKGATDNLAPLASPTPTVYGGFGLLAVTFTPLTVPGARSTTANPDPVTYDVHLSTTSTVAGDATTLVARDVSGSPVAIRTRTNGTALAPDTNYWLAVRSKDRDGNGPLSTVFGPVQLVKAGENDIVLTVAMLIANGVLADAIDAEDLTGTRITGATIRTAASGQRWQIDSLNDQNTINAYSGLPAELLPGRFSVESFGSFELGSLIRMQTPVIGPNPDNYAQVVASTGQEGNNQPIVAIEAARLDVHSTTGIGGYLTYDATTGVLDVPEMGDGSVGTGTFRDSVDARADARIAAGTPGVWTAYTPTFTAGTTNPTLGNFTRTGRYLQVGKRVDFVVVITANASTGLGTGAYEFGLPVAARAAEEVLVQGFQTGPNHVYVGRGVSATTFSVYLGDTNAGMSSGNSGITTGTVVRISGTYEAA